MSAPTSASTGTPHSAESHHPRGPVAQRPAPTASTADLPPEPGVRLVEGGAEFCVYAPNATGVTLCLFDAPSATSQTAPPERRIELTHRIHGHWFGFVPEVGHGQRYGYRARGPWEPERALRYNHTKLLIDPYARGLDGDVQQHPSLYAHHVGDRFTGDLSVPDGRDSAAYVPKSVVVDDAFDWGGDRSPGHAYADSVIYEVHVKNATALHPGIPEELRGTYAALAHPAFIAHLRDLGVTGVELLPVHAFTHEPELLARGLVNHWGYNTLNFFTPHAAYGVDRSPQAVLDEFKQMVKDLHVAGIEVYLDVVYNHTAEAEQFHRTLSWRGLDNRAYYRLDDRGVDIDVTGCGNTIDTTHTVVSRMVLDSLRYWVQECHVDGFRFDLAVALGRDEGDHFDPHHPFLVSVRNDPVLSRVKLIAEPWDLGLHGWRTGQFPPPFAEWNDLFRDAARTYWLQDLRASADGRVGHGVRDLATRLAGSQDAFDQLDRGTIASINFVTAHDGFTLADLTAFDAKHNAANGSGGMDGTTENRSWNHGVEGPTDDPEVLERRRRSMRNLLGTLLLSAGVPMLNAGDEFGRSQRGNNNPYCQDNPISWFDWNLEPWQRDLLATTRHLIRLRREFPVLRQRSFFTGGAAEGRGVPDLAWFAGDGEPMGDRWDGPNVDVLHAVFDGVAHGHDCVVLSFNGSSWCAEVSMPHLAGTAAYDLVWDSTDARPGGPDVRVRPGDEHPMGPSSMRVWRAVSSQ